MLKANKFEFSDKKIDALPLVEKMYSSADWIRNGTEVGKLKLRVNKTSKTFCLYCNDRRITLGHFCKSYGVANAIADAYQVMSGEITPAPSSRSTSFYQLGAKIFDEKERKGRKFVKQLRRKFFNQIPKHILDKQINKITKEEVLAWKETFLQDRTPAYWNKVIEVPTNIWNEASKTYAFSLLEHRRNPFSNLKEECSRNEYAVPTFAELRKIWIALRSHGNQKANFITKFKILTGMYYTEIQQLRVRHFQGEWLLFDVGMHKVSNHRNQIKHKIWLHPIVRKLVKYWLDMCELSEPEALLFSHTGIDPIHDNTFNRVWLRALQKHNLDFRFDRLRHALITDMHTSDYESKYITGHCYLENTQTKHYTDWDSEVMQSKFKDASMHWQTKVYASVKDVWF